MRRTAAEAAETRRQVLDAALLTFAERGWDGATFENIASRIRLTRGAVHHHFRGGKEELLYSVLSEQWQRYGEMVLAPLSAPGLGVGERLRSFVSGYLDLLAGDAMFRALATVTTVVSQHARTVEGYAEHRSGLDEWRAALHAVLDPPGVLRAGVSAETAVFVLMNFVVGVDVTVALEPDELPADLAGRQAAAAALVAGLICEGR